MPRVLLTDNIADEALEVFDRYEGIEGVRVDTLPSGELVEAIERYVGLTREFVEITDKAAQTPLTDDEAKLEIFSSFERGDLAPRFFPHVARNYFAPSLAVTLREQENDAELDRLIRQCGDENPTDWTDCVGRNRSGLHAAFTRAIRDLPAAAKLRSTANVARILSVN